VVEVEEAGFEGGEFGAEGEVGGGEGGAWAEGRQAGEEHVGGDLQAGLGDLEDVFWGEDGEGAQEEDGGYREKNKNGAKDGRRERADFESVDPGRGAYAAVVGEGFGEEDGPEEDEEGLDAVI
jgi:hypothetical protein